MIVDTLVHDHLFIRTLSVNHDVVSFHAKRITSPIRSFGLIYIQISTGYRSNFCIRRFFVSRASPNQNSSEVANGGMKEAKEDEIEKGNNVSEEYELPELVVFLNDVCFEKKPTLQSRGKCLAEDRELDRKIINEDEGNERILETNVKKFGEVQKADNSTISMVPKVDDVSDIGDDIIVLEEAKERMRKSDDSSDSDTERSGAEELLLSQGSNPPEPDPAEALRLGEDGPSKSRGLAESPNQAHQSFSEESSLFVAGPAGPSFRCTSHRSNSSTTSSRSFAFPVIASEWHGSPERMVRTEKRKPRKPERKCARFLCCKFF